MKTRITRAIYPLQLTYRFLACLLTLSLLATVCACERKYSDTTASGAATVSSGAAAANPHEIAGRLIKRTVAAGDGGHVAVEIDHQLLRELTDEKEQDARTAVFRDPLLAARLFAPYIGMPEDAVFSIEQVSTETEEASGLFIAVVRIDSGGASARMRLVSEPDADDQPTLWVLNDYDN